VRKAPDVHVDRARLDEPFVAPDALEQRSRETRGSCSADEPLVAVAAAVRRSPPSLPYRGIARRRAESARRLNG